MSYHPNVSISGDAVDHIRAVLDKYRLGDPLTDYDVSVGQLCTVLGRVLHAMGPLYEIVAMDLSLKGQDFERMSVRRKKDQQDNDGRR